MTIQGLISDYRGAVEECLGLFEEKFGRRDVMQAASEGAIPRTGELGNGAKYQLHGIGCRVEFPDHEVDFDFTNRVGGVGFDAWRLMQYAEQYPEKYPEHQGNKQVEAALVPLIESGAITPAPSSSTLYQFL